MIRISSACSLCGHVYESMFDWPETEAHMREAHGRIFDPGDLRKGRPPRWYSTE